MSGVQAKNPENCGILRSLILSAVVDFPVQDGWGDDFVTEKASVSCRERTVWRFSGHMQVNLVVRRQQLVVHFAACQHQPWR
jgi:hypothetical protein